MLALTGAPQCHLPHPPSWDPGGTELTPCPGSGVCCSTARGSCSCIFLLCIFLLLHLPALHHPRKKELRALGEDTARALLSLSEGAVREVLDKLCWTQGLVEGRGM